jgi:hypothetical protein
MTKVVIQVPTVKFDDNGFNKVLAIIDKVTSAPKNNFDFDFSGCARLDHHAVVVLGGLARYIDYQNSVAQRTVSNIFKSNPFSTAGAMFLVTSMSPLISNQLIQNNFLKYFSRDSFQGYPSGDYIGYREHKNILDADKIAQHLNENWLSDEKIKLSDLLKSAVVSRIFEIFMNAYGHGTSIQSIEKLGVYSCGQYDKKEKKLNLSVLDFGPGIVANVRKNQAHILNNVDAMHWALARGNSTRTDSQHINMPRGLGFDLLSAFVKLNEGEMRIYSNNICAKLIAGNGFIVEKSKFDFTGTLVSIRINCDDSYYQFLSEKKKDQKQYF